MSLIEHKTKVEHKDGRIICLDVTVCDRAFAAFTAEERSYLYWRKVNCCSCLRMGKRAK